MHEEMSSSSSDDSDGFNDVEVSEADMNLIIQLESALEQNPGYYDAYAQFIDVLRRCNMRERLREVRRAMHARFPLSESLWLDWITDELEAISGEEDIPKIEALLEDSHKDYLSISLWFQHLELTRGFDAQVQSGTPEGVSRMRALCERAITAAGLHPTEGDRLWQIYLEFEMQQEADAPADEKEEAAERVRALYRRRLAVPLSRSADALAAYESWEKERKGGVDEDELVPKPVRRSFQVAQQAYELREPFESTLAAAAAAGGTDLLAAYMGYLKVEESGGDPARVQLLYERAVAAFPLTHFLWLRYGRYVEATLKTPSAAEAVYTQASRNCPWVGEIWARLLRVLERGGAQQERQDAVHAAAMAAGLQSPEDLLDVALARVDALRRLGGREPLEKLREVCCRAQAAMAAAFPAFFDPSLKLTAYWADFEVRLGGEDAEAVEAGRQVWNNALSVAGGAARHAETWLGFVAFERRWGTPAKARAVFKRCFARAFEGGGRVAVCESWLRFEREQGSAEDHLAACLKVEPLMEEAAAAVYTGGGAAVSQQPAAAVEKKEKPVELSKEAVRAMRQQADPNFKRRRQEEAEAGAQGGGAVAAMPPPPAKRAKQQEGNSEENPAPAAEFAAEGKAPASINDGNAAAADGTRIPLPRAAPGGAPPPGSGITPERRALTAFVKHLPDDASEASLRELFGGCGPIRLVKLGIDHATGRSKGFAYVEFETQEGVDAACRMSGTVMGPKKLFVALSNPPASGGGGGFGGREGGRGRGRGEGGRGGGGRGRGGLGYAPRHQEESGSGGGGVGPRRGLGFVPRAALGKGVGKKGSAPKSNADFRKMLLEKKKE